MTDKKKAKPLLDCNSGDMARDANFTGICSVYFVRRCARKPRGMQTRWQNSNVFYHANDVEWFRRRSLCNRGSQHCW